MHEASHSSRGLPHIVVCFVPLNSLYYGRIADCSFVHK